MKRLLVLVFLMFPDIVLALPTTFNLRDPAIEGFDEVVSFSLTQDGLAS